MNTMSNIPVSSQQKFFAIFLIFILLAGAVGTPGSTAQARTNSPESLGVQVEAAMPRPALQAGCTPPYENEIEEENCLPGNPPSEWDVSGAGDANIQGFATDISVNQGGTVHFKIDTDSNNYHIDIYRIGYYNGDGARLITTISPSAAVPQTQPACLFDAAGGVNLLDCGNWAESASWAVPANMTSGLFIAKLVRDDATPGASHITFIVRDDDGNSDLLFQTSDTTWQAYNGYGGYSLYAAPNHAHKVSYNRPFLTRSNSTEDFWFNSEYPMIRWLERNGYDVSYFTDVDSHRNAAEILEHDVFLSVGHDEYWSAEQRTAVEAARDAGVHLAFFSGNSVYWKTRWENSTDGSNTPFRTLVSYKEGSLAGSEHYTCQGNDNCDPDPDTWTGLWRDGCSVAGHDGCNPENNLMGTISWMGNTDTIQVPEVDGNMRFWRNTTLASLPIGTTAALEGSTLGYEWDHEQALYIDDYPDGRFWLTSTGSNGQTHHLSMYRAPSGALAFGAGTVQWMWGLDGNHDRGVSTEDGDMQQATVNLFADMGVQPATLQATLTVASASTDSANPTAAITSPISGADAPSGSPLIISGTASDTGGGVVGAVEISLDNGTTWLMATGLESWTYTWIPSTPGSTANIRARAIDDSGNIGAATAPISVNVIERVCPCSIWDDTFTPTGSGNDAQPIEVGVKFQSTETGYITGLRFYKDAANTGTHTGHLWANDGTQLAEAIFTSETASGWQNVYFSTPVQIQANTTYVASYHSSGGGYSFDDQYFTAEFNSPPLRALADGEDGPNAVYVYGASAFPTLTYQSANYWVDVIFDATPQVYSVWEQAPITGSANSGDTNAIEVGMKFRADVPGSVIGVKFYKGSNNTGPFLGHLWNMSGTQLEEQSYTNNTADEGWQEIIFDTPVPIAASTTYIISYFTQSGNYSFAGNYFIADIYNPPLRALADGVDGLNGVYNYYASGFPASSFNASNYWVDVLFAPDTPIDNTPPTVTSVTPLNGATNVSLGTAVTVTFNEAMDSQTLNTSTFELRDASNNLVPATISYNSATRTATLTPDSPLALTATYTARVIGSASGAADAAGNPLAADYNWSFSTLGPPPNEGPGGPILVLSSAANPFSRYYAEILRAEGLNEFTATDITNLTAALLDSHQGVILGEMTLTPTEVGLISNWVNNGGNLIAMRPDPQLTGLLGLTTAGGTLGEGYLLVNTASTPGQGIVNQTMQYHGTADLYTLNGATTIATLYSNATTATANPAVTTVNVGLNGGQAAAFTYDLAKSIVYTRQGNPAWMDINGDGSPGPIRADDMFHNGTDPDWVDLSKVAIPQADEQQRLLVNMILSMNADENPLPHFWYFPRFEKAVVLMTADDHASANVAGRFDQYIAASPSGCSVADWECIRSSIYLYPGSTLTAAQATTYTNQGFEVGVHVDTGCGNFSLAQLDTYYTTQLAQFAARFPTLPQQDSERTHCIAWSNWAYQPTIKEQKGIRLDTNYYFWPPAWVNNTPGFFTGSGIPMRFADLDGTMFDVFQATTQMTDESVQSYPFTIDTLLNRAVGAEGYYGVFTANMHSDNLNSSGSDAIVASAQSHDVPVVSGRQLLEWIDGRNFSAFSGISWNGNALDFHVSVGGGANGLYALLPTQSNAGPLQSITRDGTTPVTYTIETVKGIEYAVFSAAPSGDFQAVYSLDTTGPVISNIAAAVNPDGTVTITWDTDEASDSSVDFGTDSNILNLNSTDGALVTAHSITLTGLTPNTTYYFRVTSADASANPSTSPTAPATLDFTTPSGSLNDTLLTDFNSGTLGCTYPMQIGNGALILTPTIAAEFDGFVLPAGWSSNLWTGTAPTFGGGQVTLNGVSIRNDTLLNAGTSLEFAATFGNQSYQHIGFGGGDPTYNAPPWAMFSTGGDGAQLYARVHTGSGGDDLTPLGASYLGSSHQYRIDWNAGSVDFYIDGSLVLTRAIAVPGQMRVAASDLTVGNPALIVDWMHVSPYASPCTFTSQAFDAGQAVNWETMSWTGQTPAGTSFAFSYRIGNTPTPDGTWTSFSPVPTSGSALTGNTRYIQYQTVLTTTNNLVTPVLEDVSITYSLGADVTPPTIVGRDPAPNETDVDETTDITVTFNEPMDPTTIIPANFALIIDGPNTPVPFTLTYSGVTATLNPDSDLTPGTQYAMHVDGAVEDLAGNPLGTDSDWTFVTTASGLIDTTISNFGAGANACYIAETANGELILNPTVAAEFSGAALPAGWTSTPWTPPNGTSTVSGGQVTVDGALAYYSTSTFTPGRSMEFVATFTASQYQHVGLLGAATFTGTWAIFSTNDTTNQLFARTSDGTNTLIPGTWLDSPHRYRIDWTATTVSFYIDGAFYAQHNVALADMRPAISDYNVGGTAAIVDWIRMSPYGTPCAFESRIFDAGSVVDWQNLISTGSTPVGTNVAFETRTGNTLTPDVTWSAWEPTSGVIASPNGQYAQYRVTLGTSNVDITPVIESVELTYLVVVNHAPTTSGIADVTVDEDASDSTLDLWTSFADSDEPDSALTYTIEANTNPTLFTSAAITGNQNLVLDFAPNLFGTADITIRATDTGGLYVEDTFTVTVNSVNDIPTTTGIADVIVDEDALDTTIDLFPSFADVEDADTALTYTVTGNTDATLFTSVTVTGGQNLVLDYAPNASGTAQITVRATDTGTGYIETTFTVLVNPVNDTPTDIALTNDNVDENLAIGTLVGTFSTTDVDTGDTFTYTFCGGTNDSSFSLSGDQLLTAASFDFEAQNSYSICIRSTDSGTAFFDETFTISVNNVNEAPTTSGIVPVTVDEDAADSTLDLWTSFADAEDADGALTYSIENNTNPTLFTSFTITGGQNLVLNYAPNTSGTADITIRATDTGTLFVETTFTVTVNAVNDNPTTSGIANLNVNEDAVDSTINLFPSFADVEDANAQLTYTVTGNTNAALFTSTNVTGGQNLVLDFAPNQSGTADITVRATDTGGFYIETTFTVTIAPVNDDPTTSGIAAVIVNEDAPDTTIDLWTSFADLEDADAQLTYSVTGNTNAALFTSAGIAGNQNLVLDYAPNANGSSQITILATDTGGLFVPTTFTVTVNPVNDAPFFTSAPITSGTEDAAYTYNIVTLDPDTSDTLVITAPTLPGWLTLTDNNDSTATLTGTPANANVGSNNVTLRVNDGTTDVDQTFTIDVANVNDPPAFTSTPLTTATEDAAYTYNVTASDPDLGAVLTFTAPTLPAWLTLNPTGNGTATLSGTPTNAEVGTHNVTLSLTDGTVSVDQIFIITVANTNDAPAFTSAPVTNATEDAAYSYTITAADPDLGDTLTITAPTLPGWLSFTDNGGGTASLTGTPTNAEVGTHTVTLTVSDGTISVDQVFIITVANTNDSPAFTSAPITIATQGNFYTYNVIATDPDSGDLLTLSTPTLPAWLTLTPTGNGTATLSGTPTNADVGINNVTLRVNDGTVDVDQVFTINVTDVNEAPTDITLSNAVIDEGLPVGSLVGTLSTTDPDLGDSFTYSFCGGADDASFQFNGSNLETAAVLDADAQSSFSICIHSQDASGSSVEETFVITLNNVNDAPVISLQSTSQNVNENSPLLFNNAGNTRITVSDADAGANPVQVTLSVTQGTLTLNSVNGLTFITGTGTADTAMTFSATLTDINAALDGMRYDPVTGYNGADQLQVTVDDLGYSGTGGAQTDSASMDLNVLNTAPMVLANGVNTVTDTGDGILSESEVVTANITQFIITFDQDLNDAGPTDPDSVTNLNNYRLIHDNGNDFQTAGCDSPVSAQDIVITINSVVYDNNGGSGPFIVTLNVNDGLPLVYGNYRLYVCGTTSITDPTGLELAGDGNNAGTDFRRAFTIPNTTGGGGTGGGTTTDDEEEKKAQSTKSILTSGVLIPVTGFEPGVSTPLPTQASDLAYTIEDDLRLEIPSLSINQPIVGIPFLNEDWNVTWLGSRIGYLEGSAYPTWSGNTVLTGHATDPNGKLTSFGFIKDLTIGDKVMIHYNGLVYVYQIQQNRLISASSTSALFRHEEHNWITLVTCENWNNDLGMFVQRRIVRAALVSVIPEE